MKRTLPIILEYCGGERTDRLYERMSAFNQSYEIHVLDNASPHTLSRYVTTRNSINSFIGGGLCDCLDFAERRGAEFLFFVSNDIELVREPSIEHFESVAASDPSAALVGVSITGDSAQARVYPWMINQGENGDRIVPHYDPLCCLIRIEFIRRFGGFPPSKGGWGYDWEMASYAKFRNLKIICSDTALIRHLGDRHLSYQALGNGFNKWEEMKQIYNQRYGDYRLLLAWRISRQIAELEIQFGEVPRSANKTGLTDADREGALNKMRNEIPDFF
jgi:hypothetical protein